MKKMEKILILLFAFFIFFSLWGFFWAIRPLRITSNITPKKYHVNYEDVSFLTSDQVLIRGWFIPSAKPKAKTIILMHGYPADKGDILPAMIFLHDEYNLLFFDFRYFGQSGGHYSTIGKNEVLDLLAAIQFLKTKGIHEVGVWGFSLGGAVALMTAPQAPEIKAVISESSYARLDWMAYEYYPIPLFRYPLGALTRLWGIVFLGYDIKQVSPQKAAENLKIPVLLIHSTRDNVIPFEHALLLEKALNHNPQAKMVFTGDGVHGQFVVDHEKMVREFFEKNLK